MPRRLSDGFHTRYFFTLFVAFVTVLAAVIPPPLLAGQLAPAKQSQEHRSGDGTPDSGNPLLLPVVPYRVDGLGVWSVAIGDVNGDGKPDVVAANSIGSVTVFVGNGDGTFQAAGVYDTGGTEPLSIAVGDFNGDSKLDVIVADVHDGDVGVLLGNGDGTFQPVVTYSSGISANAFSVTVADVNGDGELDVLVAVNDCNEGCRGLVSVLLGRGDGTLRPPVVYSTGGYYIASAAVADVNRDGKLDLIAANLCSTPAPCSTGYSAGTVGVLLGNGDGTFQLPVTYGSGGKYLNYDNAEAVAIADVNLDGKVDIIVTDGLGGNGTNGAVGVLLGNGDGTFQPVATYDSGGSVLSAVTVADMNGDGKPDIVLTNECLPQSTCNPYNSTPQGSVGVLLGNGDGTFQPAILFTSASGTNSLAVADLNGDGWLDVVVPNDILGSGGIGILMNDTGPHSPTTTTMVSSANPAAKNEVVSYTATVMGKSPTRTVSFLDGGKAVATVEVLNSKATYSTSYPKQGAHVITAEYGGDAVNSGSNSAPLSEYIANLPAASTTTLQTSGSPSRVRQPVTFTATVTSKYGMIPDGELVTFSDGSAKIGTGTTVRGVAMFTTSSLKAKKHNIKAKYAGDGDFKPSTGTVTQVVEE